MSEAGLPEEMPHGWRRYVYATNHKDIGTMFLVFAALAAVVGGFLAFRLRMELMAPGLQDFESLREYSVAMTGHGVSMVFFCLLPAMVGFGYWLVPLIIGAPGLAFPRMGNLSFWLLPFAFLLFAMSFAVIGDADGKGVASGWQLSAPLSSYGASGPATDFLIGAILMAVMSLLLAAIDFIVTILNMRAPGMSLHKMPLLPWAMLISAFVLLLSLPVLCAALVMLLADRHFGATVFNPAGGGDPVLYQHLFWFFAHSSSIVALLPAIGIVGHVLSAFSGRAVFGRVGIAYAMIATAAIGMAGWGMHLTTLGLGFQARAFFLVVNLAQVIPVTVMVLSLIATMWGGSLVFRTPMLWAIGFLPVFAIGVLAGLVLGGGGANVVLRGTAFEIAYSHYMGGAAVMFAFFAGWYFWFPKFTGYRYGEFLSKIHFWLSFVGIHLVFFPMFFLGLAGFPRGVGDYPPAFSGWNWVSGVGVWVLVAGVGMFVLATVFAFLQKRPAGNNPWGGAVAGLEWTLSSPPPYQTFDELPKIR